MGKRYHNKQELTMGRIQGYPLEELQYMPLAFAPMGQKQPF